MVEYLYDAIKAVAGQEIVINAFITNEKEETITENCSLVLYDQDGDTMLIKVPGVYLPKDFIWEFRVPAEITMGLKGRYWYYIMNSDSNLCFKQPIYLV